MASDSTPTFFERYGRWLAWAILTLALGFFIWQVYTRYVPTYYGLADEHGYLTTAKRLALHGELAQHQSDPYAFIGETMMQSPADPSVYYLRQPLGYPLITAAAYYLGGAEGPFAVNPLLGLALIFGIYRVGCGLGSQVGGAVAGAVMAASTLVLYYTIEPLSHILDMTLAVWCITAALAWRKDHKWWQAALCGLLVGAAVLTRYVSVLLLLPLFVILLEKFKTIPRRIMLGHITIAGGMMFIAIIPLLMYQHAAYGSIFRTGYSAGDNATSFSLAWFLAHAPAMSAILAMPEFGISAMLLAALAGIVVFFRKKNWFVPTMLLAWALPPLIVYTAYYGMSTKNMLLYARFALPSFVPLVLLGAVWPISVVRQKTLAYGSVIAAAIATVALNTFLNPKMDKQFVDTQNYHLYTYAAELILHQNVPSGSVVIGDNYTHYFADYTGDYVVYDPSMFKGEKLEQRLADLTQKPHEFDPARTRQLQELLGNRTDAQRFAILREQLEKYAASGKPIYLLTTDINASYWQQMLALPMKSIAQNEIALHLFEIDARAAH